jgi:hypothetical protein
MDGEMNLAELTKAIEKISTVNTAEEVNATAIRSTSVIFTPAEKIREMFNNVKFQKV